MSLTTALRRLWTMPLQFATLSMDPSSVLEAPSDPNSPEPPSTYIGGPWNLDTSSIKALNQAQSRFLQLPAEIRIKIYSYCLLSSSPILICPAEPSPSDPRSTHANNWRQLMIDELNRKQGVTNRLICNHVEMVSAARDLAPGLLRCNTTVAAETAEIFYRRNTFRFQCNERFQRVVTWLNKLHGLNRSYLEYLEIDIPPPSQTAQTRSTQRRPRQTYSITHGFSPFHHNHVCPKDDDVHLIDPSIETIISHLAKRRSDRTMTLCLDVGYMFVPGIDQWVGEDMVLVNMDLPDLVEAWRRKYCSEVNCTSLDVVWKVTITDKAKYAMRKWITGIGWEIFDERQDGIGPGSSDQTQYFLRRSAPPKTTSRRVRRATPADHSQGGFAALVAYGSRVNLQPPPASSNS
ncbi:MAG: hypothetical protein Q9168_006912 [Polycauliona sp. 1 TL-2023]